MKKYLYSLILLLVISINAYADGLTATLQQGDIMTAFYGERAFFNAYYAADSGAVITLSPGHFPYFPDTIKKEITIIGAGAFGADNNTNTSFAYIRIKANNVKIEGIHLSGSNSALYGTENCYIKRCRISGKIYDAEKEHFNTIVDNCVIREEGCAGFGVNYCIKNSIIDHFIGNVVSIKRQLYVTNSVILNFAYYDSSRSTWIYSQPVGIYKNNVLGYYCNNSSASAKNLANPSEYYYNLIMSTYSSDYGKLQFGTNCINSGNKKGLLKNYYSESYSTYSRDATNLYGLRTMIVYVQGQDGTSIGVAGGTGFSSYPSIPRVTSKTVSPSTDKDGKINVKLTVEVEQ